jgi:hypothetical protein
MIFDVLVPPAFQAQANAISPSPIVNIVCPGRVSSNLARDVAAKSIIHRGLVAGFKYFATLPTDVGARQLVLAATTSPAEHGKFIRPYYTDAEYDEYVTSAFENLGNRLTRSHRIAKKVITGEEGQKMQATVWGEILEVLEAKVPEVKAIAHPKS